MITVPLRQFQSIKVIDPVTAQDRSCYLVKYEKRRYETIRIGTLAYYRNIEGHQGDALDGRVEGIVFEPDRHQPVTRDEMLAISGGSFDVVARDGMAFGKGASYQDEKSRRCQNVYVYCCSMEFGVFPNPERMAHFNAREFSVIDNTLEFRNVVAAELITKARTTEGLPYDREKHYLKSWEAPVRYRSRRLARMELPLNNLDFFVYQKDPAFAVEQEYRFVWIFFDRKTDIPIEVATDPVDIPRIETWGVARLATE